MNTNRSYAVAAAGTWGGSLFSKLILAFAIVALMFAAFPATHVLAASGDEDQPWEKVDLDKEWRDKLRLLQVEGLFYNQTRFYPADFDNSADLSRAWDLLHKHGFALKQANTVVFNHSGFDIKGNVTNERLAYNSVHDLAMYLHMMRGLRMKIYEEGYKVHRVR